MYIAPQITHDIKTERADVLPPLPSVLRIIPIVFYGIAALSLGLLGLTVYQIRGATVGLEEAQARTKESERQIEETRAARASLENSAKLAADILQWVEGATAVQPLTVALGRSMGTKAALTELTLSRDEKAPRQIQLALKMQSADALQIESTIEAVRQSNFRPFSAKQSQEGNRVSYEVSLIEQAAPVPRETPAPTPPNE